MAQAVRVGTILVSGWPPLFDLETEAYSGSWSRVKLLDGTALDRKVRAAGWNFFFIASEVRTAFVGAIGAKKLGGALNRILIKLKPENFNSLEVTGIVRKKFMGFPYTIVSAHSRHLQSSCYLHGPEARRLLRRGK
jgi:hypothetical protein